MRRYREFEFTSDHIKLLRRAYVTWYDCEFGAPAIDCKRPYGNSSVIFDLVEILEPGLEPDEDGFPEDVVNRVEKLHHELETALQIVLATGSFETGLYRAESYSKDWVRVSDLEGEE